ncbi:Helicase conserved C-terminal domain-containing protein [Sanguibacter gelidistatuariae]|uniref:Helicase conserved C-terminal domain-containing protein n=1 Tax=Sanguibacter gelidistatuariae TaxID=1814289 RepID=A0A1G6PVP6_9MICO|nr:helicase-associated domain-containing protein [Sanguibacter gelidistatuariae]SDC83596.1 Helicase conserved C-terminal domain-containing protein [Sanguibacter gelidistatuariae]
MVTFSDWLCARSDAELVALLSHRADLASPSPSTLLSLAARATSRASLQRATTALDAAHLMVLESVAVLDSLGEIVTTERVVAAIAAEPAIANDATTIPTLLEDLTDTALLWQSHPGIYRPAPGIEETLDAYPAGLGPALLPRDGRPDTAILQAPDAPAGARAILAALQWGPPVGRIPSASDSPTAAAIGWLIDRGFVRQVDAHHVMLPREIALDLRSGRTHRGLPPAPALPEPTLTQATIDAESARAAQEIVRRVAEVISTWQVAPAPALKAGGLGVRELRRLAQQLEVDELTTAFVVELALMTGLVTSDGADPASFAPTVEADEWLAADLPARWAALASAWCPSARAPWLVGSRDDRGALRSALEPELHRMWVPRLRSELLRVLAQAPRAAVHADAVVAVLTWRSPRSVPPHAAVVALLREANLLGITGAHSLAIGGHVLAAAPPLTVPDDATRLALAGSLTQTLPEAVDELLLQGDLTGIVPGRPTPELEALLTESTEVESRGAGVTVRFTAASVTRALDAGRTADELLTELTQHSRAAIPQPLDYLVHDAARRHGQVRLGVAASYVRVDDPVLLAGLVDDPKLASLGLFSLAPTVLAATAPAAQLLTALRERGLAPAMEDPDGNVVYADLRAAYVRLPTRRGRRAGQHSRSVDGSPERALSAPERTERLRGLVARLREQSHLTQARRTQGAPSLAAIPAASGTGGGPGTSDPLVALGLLREAAADGREVWLDMVGPAGGITRRRVRPLRIDAGRLRAVDVARESEITVAVHRVAGVEHVAESD